MVKVTSNKLLIRDEFNFHKLLLFLGYYQRLGMVWKPQQCFLFIPHRLGLAHKLKYRLQ